MQQRIGQALFHVQKHIDPGYEAADAAWCDTEHIPLLLTYPGFLSARRYVLESDGRQHLVVYQLDGPEALKSDAFLSARTRTPPKTQEMLHHQSIVMGPYQHYASAGDVTATHQEIGKAMLQVKIAVEPSWVEEWDRWMDEEHIPERMVLPGFLSARRFVTTVDSTPAQQGGEGAGSPAPGQAPPRLTAEREYSHLTMYEMEDERVLTSEAYLALRTTTSERTRRNAAHMRSVRSVYLQHFPEVGAAGVV